MLWSLCFVDCLQYVREATLSRGGVGVRMDARGAVRERDYPVLGVLMQESGSMELML